MQDEEIGEAARAVAQRRDSSRKIGRDWTREALRDRPEGPAFRGTSAGHPRGDGLACRVLHAAPDWVDRRRRRPAFPSSIDSVESVASKAKLTTPSSRFGAALLAWDQRARARSSDRRRGCARSTTPCRCRVRLAHAARFSHDLARRGARARRSCTRKKALGDCERTGGAVSTFDSVDHFRPPYRENAKVEARRSSAVRPVFVRLLRQRVHRRESSPL